MDPIIAAILQALSGTTIVLIPAYLVWRGQLAKIKQEAQAEARQAIAEAKKLAVETRASDRDDDRDDVKALWEENRRLRQEIREREERDAEKLAAQSERIAKLETQVGELLSKACPWNRVDCPRIAAVTVGGNSKGG